MTLKEYLFNKGCCSDIYSGDVMKVTISIMFSLVVKKPNQRVTILDQLMCMDDPSASNIKITTLIFIEIVIYIPAL